MVALVAAVAATAALTAIEDSLPTPARAGHSGTYVFPGAPFTGSWGFRAADACTSGGSDTGTVPPAHHILTGGHFGLDYFGCSGTVGRFYAWKDSGVTTYGKVTAKLGSCSNPNEYKGQHYEIALYNGTVQRGDYDTAHVHTIGYADGVIWGAFGNPPYELYVNQTLYFGTLIGFTTSEWLSTDCYAVNNSGGAHWHLQVANIPPASIEHYASYYSRPAGTQLYAADYIGISGANIYTYNTACP